jgi:hypothetical protein
MAGRCHFRRDRLPRKSLVSRTQFLDPFRVLRSQIMCFSGIRGQVKQFDFFAQC